MHPTGRTPQFILRLWGVLCVTYAGRRAQRKQNHRSGWMFDGQTQLYSPLCNMYSSSKSTSLTNKWMIIFTRNGKNVFLQLISFFYGLFVINSILSLFSVGISWDCTILSQKSMQILSHLLVDVSFLALQNFAEFLQKLQFSGPKLQLRRYFICLTRRVEICWLCGHNMLQSAVTSAKTSTHGETDVTNAHLQLNMSTGDNCILGSQRLTQDREKTTKSKTKSVPTRNSASQSSSANKSTTKSSAPHTSSSRSTDKSIHVLHDFKELKDLQQ